MAVDMFCKIDGIDGESTDDKHAKWIEIDSYTCGVSQPVSGKNVGGLTGGKADFQPFGIVKTVDAATPDLHTYCANGKHIPKVEIECCLATEDKHVFMKYTLEDAIVSSITATGSVDDVRPAEKVTFAYGKIKWDYTPIDKTGKPGAALSRAWNVGTNAKG
ncbi:MAG: type VI secretion system tube protein Hcp [Candidatus Thiothrix putei]|uniref:Type VI secretion system tube protein Hcp n=1 Tax=Candidatus Thiothrix putei TaxID=3080811 RepID=A0AA95KIK0_9GAMM|nr:MAG: type VI secretion system tube protein Hcp [Candidatus Thiothrix putei]